MKLGRWNWAVDWCRAAAPSLYLSCPPPAAHTSRTPRIPLILLRRVTHTERYGLFTQEEEEETGVWSHPSRHTVTPLRPPIKTTYTSVPNNLNNNNNNDIISTNHSLLTSTSYITCNPIQNLNLYLHKHVYLCIYLCQMLTSTLLVKIVQK